MDKEKFEEIVKINKNILKNSVDYDKLEKAAFLRNKQDGDKFFLSERNLSKSLKKLFIEDKIPAAIRPLIPVLTNGEEICWVLGYGSTQEIAVSETTKTIATFRCRGILE